MLNVLLNLVTHPCENLSSTLEEYLGCKAENQCVATTNISLDMVASFSYIAVNHVKVLAPLHDIASS